MTEPPLPELIGSQVDPEQERRLEVIGLRFLLISPAFWLISTILLIVGEQMRVPGIHEPFSRYSITVLSGGATIGEIIALLFGLIIWRSTGGRVVIFSSLLVGSLFGFLVFLTVAS